MTDRDAALRACFCGNNPRLAENAGSESMSYPSAKVICDYCGARTREYSYRDSRRYLDLAVKEWNDRAALTSEAEPEGYLYGWKFYRADELTDDEKKEGKALYDHPPSPDWHAIAKELASAGSRLKAETGRPGREEYLPGSAGDEGHARAVLAWKGFNAALSAFTEAEKGARSGEDCDDGSGPDGAS